MEKIIEQLKEWSYLQTLEQEFAGFTLTTELMQCESQYRIFTYHNSGSYRSFSVLYDEATKEFLARVVIGLTEMCDISFIVSDLNGLEQLLNVRMKETIRQLASFDPITLCSSFREKKITEWAFGAQLPQQVAGFALYITPLKPVKSLNGSYIIIDYSDFSVDSNLLIYYNIYRDEFFGELRVRRTPRVISTFDTKQLSELEQCLKTHLEKTLTELRLELTSANAGEGRT
ncbi:hypothetical protein [Anaerospora hongkongensis]|uniref:hypothetical protein n=1 Tax=Anaerospora hongkongensis TaxID=244830 RepID=UPI002FDAFA3B